MSDIYYLAAPYTSKDIKVENAVYNGQLIAWQRAHTANKVAAFLMAQHGFIIFSPLSHSFGIVEHLPDQYLSDQEFWMKQCLAMVKASSGMIVLALPGWRESKGVAKEIELALALDIPIYLLTNQMKEIDWNGCDAFKVLGIPCDECAAEYLAKHGLTLKRVPQGMNPIIDFAH